MITEGIITQIDYSTNRCFVRIPLLETVGNSDTVVYEGRILIPPGMYNGYLVDDCVWITFVDEKYNQPLIIGKIYKGATYENLVPGGNLNVSSLNVKGTNASIPKQTKINGADTEFKDINSLIFKIKDLENQLELEKLRLVNFRMATEERLNSLNEILGKTLRDVTGTVLCDATGEPIAPKDI